MKRWFCFLLVCWGVVFLLLNPVHQAGVNHQLHASCDGSVNCWREFVPTSIRTLPATSIAFVRSRAGTLKSLVACWALLTPADGIGPPWLDERWPQCACSRPKTCRATGQASSSEERQSTLPPRNSLRSTGRAKTRGFGGVEKRRSDFSLPVAIGEVFTAPPRPVGHGSVSSSRSSYRPCPLGASDA